MFVVIAVFLGADVFAQGSQTPGFWSSQKKGANGTLHKFRPEWFAAAADAGLQFVRFAPDKLPADDRDFLIGNADRFTSLNQADLAVLMKVLDAAHENDLKIVLVMYSLPGARWSQNNGDVDDYRLWQDDAFQEQAFEFWKQLAAVLKDHPAIVGYNPLNEPHPGKQFGYEEANAGFRSWQRTAVGTPADLNRFNRGIVAAIRSVDPETPVILDGYFYADAEGMPYIEMVDDPNTLYAFHNIAPWQYAAFRVNKGRYSYPDSMPPNWDSPGVRWTVGDLAQRIDSVSSFAAENDLPAERIIASEFWCDRRVAGCREYLADTIDLYNAKGWHWSFYAFRSDGDWGGLDYELGTEPGLGWKYWQAVESGEDGEALKNRHDNPLWEVIKKELR